MGISVERMLVLSAAFVSILSCPTLLAQTSTPLAPLPGHSSSGLTGARNRWQLTVTDPSNTPDLIPSPLRAERNSYWQPILAKARAAEAGGRHVVFSGFSSSTAPELLPDPKAIWAIAKFESFRTYSADKDGELLYTELTLRITNLIRKPFGSKLQDGSSIQEDFPGGRLKKPNGSIVSWHIQPSDQALEPNHTYLIVALPTGDGELYSIQNEWDLTSGKATSNRPGEIYRQTKGESKLIGLSEDEIVAYLKQHLAPVTP